MLGQVGTALATNAETITFGTAQKLYTGTGLEVTYTRTAEPNID